MSLCSAARQAITAFPDQIAPLELPEFWGKTRVHLLPLPFGLQALCCFEEGP